MDYYAKRWVVQNHRVELADTFIAPVLNIQPQSANNRGLVSRLLNPVSGMWLLIWMRWWFSWDRDKMALFTVLMQGGGREREIRNLTAIEVIVEEEGGKQWALTDTAVSIITAKCDTMSQAIIKACGPARREIHCKQLTCAFFFFIGLLSMLLWSLKVITTTTSPSLRFPPFKETKAIISMRTICKSAKWLDTPRLYYLTDIFSYRLGTTRFVRKNGLQTQHTSRNNSANHETMMWYASHVTFTEQHSAREKHLGKHTHTNITGSDFWSHRTNRTFMVKEVPSLSDFKLSP